jgi:hypothetical protein
MNWSEWTSFDAVPAHDGPAAYQFRLVIDERPVPIPRLLGIDQDGILVVGCTGSMAQRHWQSQSARRTANGSSTMNLLYYLERFTPLARVFPGCTYQYRFLRLESVEEAKVIEDQLIKRYVCQYADRPPLNSVIPNRYGGWDEAAQTQ